MEYEILKHALLPFMTQSEADSVGKPPKPNCLLCVQRAVSGSADLGIRVCLSSGPEGRTTVCVCQLAHRQHENNTERVQGSCCLLNG